MPVVRALPADFAAYTSALDYITGTAAVLEISEVQESRRLMPSRQA